MNTSGDIRAATRVTGTVTSFDTIKGYGFAAQTDRHELFVDPVATPSDNVCILAIGDRVRFVVTEGSDGPCVSSVRAY